MGRAAGNRDQWWGAPKVRSTAQVDDKAHAQEPYIPFEPKVIAETDEYLVVDKPAFLPATPNGRIVANTVQERLRRRRGEPELVSMHRLDRMTSGLLLLSRNPQTRGAYQQLFQRGQVHKTYECLTVMPDDWEPGQSREITVHILNVPGERGVRVLEGPDAQEATTQVTFMGATTANIGDVLAGGSHAAGCSCGTCATLMQVGHWKLEPRTGRTHQLRATMDYLQYPILGEDTYGGALRRPSASLLAPVASEPYSPVLRLLATELAFIDPLSGQLCHYRTEQSLSDLAAASDSATASRD